jgi:transcription antitermination factor NusG
MQKNWYILYTKPKCEKKVASLLTKRKTENFCPLNHIKLESLRRDKFLQEPLFKSYIFVKIAEKDIPPIKNTEGVISLLYWMGKPAIIKDDEIEYIREFTNDHQNIELQKTEVNPGENVHVLDGPIFSVDGKIYALKNKTVKVNLPSLGYTMIAKIQDESIFGQESRFVHNSILNS